MPRLHVTEHHTFWRGHTEDEHESGRLARFGPDLAVKAHDLVASKNDARTLTFIQLDFYDEGSIHADVVGGREGIGPTATTAPRPNAGLQVVEAPRMGRGRASGAPPDGQI